MTIDNITVVKLTARDGFLLTNGETITDSVYMSVAKSTTAWWEIPNPEYNPEDDGSYLHPYLYDVGIAVHEGYWYYTEEVGHDLPHEAIKSGIPIDFRDKEFFEYFD